MTDPMPQDRARIDELLAMPPALLQPEAIELRSEVEQLRVELAEAQRVSATLRASRAEIRTKLNSALAAAEAERDAYREALDADDKGSLILAQWETIAAADNDRDRLAGEVEQLRLALAPALDALTHAANICQYHRDQPPMTGPTSRREVDCYECVQPTRVRTALSALDALDGGESRG